MIPPVSVSLWQPHMLGLAVERRGLASMQVLCSNKGEEREEGDIVRLGAQ